MSDVERVLLEMEGNTFDNMPGVGVPFTARCSEHGDVTVWPGFSVGGGKGHVVLRNCHVPCPICSQLARIYDGQLDLVDLAVRELLQVPVGKEAALKILKIVKEASTPEIAIEQIHNVEPKVAEVMDQARRSRWTPLDVLTTVAVIVTILAGSDDAIDNAEHAVAWMHQKLNAAKEIFQERAEDGWPDIFEI